MTLTKYDSSTYLLEREKAGSLTCSECGEIFQKPVLATVSSNGFSRTYYACPRCLAKVEEATSPKTEGESSKTVIVQRSGKRQEVEGKCPHFFGFLKKRPKNMPIPDECLICSRMIECLT